MKNYIYLIITITIILIIFLLHIFNKNIYENFNTNIISQIDSGKILLRDLENIKLDKKEFKNIVTHLSTKYIT